MLRGALIGSGIALLCVVPPVIHWITGPLAPFIGGFFGVPQTSAGARSPLTPLMIGLLMAVFVPMGLGVFAVPAYMVVSLFIQPPDISLSAAVAVGALVGAYTFILGTIGAYVGAAVKGRRAVEQGAS
jgi:hypothetical protein